MALAPVAYMRRFEIGLTSLYAERVTKGLEFCQRKEAGGASTVYFDRIAPNAAPTAGRARFAATSYLDENISRRLVQKTTLTQSMRIDQQDSLQTATDLGSFYIRNIGESMARQLTVELIAGAIGNATDVDATLGTSLVPLPAANTIDKDVGGVDSNMSVAKLLAVKRAIRLNNIPEGTEVAVLLNGAMIDGLYGEEQFTRWNFNESRPLMDGSIGSGFLGFNLVPTNELPGAGTDVDPALAVVLVRDAVGYVRDGLNTRMAEDLTTNFSMVMWGEELVGFTRVQDEGVHVIECVYA